MDGYVVVLLTAILMGVVWKVTAIRACWQGAAY
jgi:hypothetical protein